MSALFIPTLYVMSGLCAGAALHHGIAASRRQARRIHLLFAALALIILVLVLAKATAYQAQTAETLVALRKLEVASVCLLFALLPWFVAEYTDVRPRRLLAGLTAFWILMFAVNLALPHGVQYVDVPRLTHFELPWGERVVDLRVLQRSGWHNLGWMGIFVVMGFSVYACIAQHRRGQEKKARALAWGLGLFFGAVLFNWAVNRELIRFVHLSDLGFIALLVLMDVEMMLESRNESRRMRDVLDRLPAAICLKDANGRFRLANRAFEQAFGVSNEDLVGTTHLEALPREQAERLRADEVRAIETRREVANEHVLDGHGTPRLYESYQFPLLRADDTAYAVCGVYVDVTEVRRKDEVLDKLRHQVWHTDRVASTGAITGSLAHELVQPLAAILNNAQAGLRFLEQDRVDRDEMRDLLEDIVRDDKRAAAVISGLRALLQRQETPRAEIDLAACIDEVTTLLHSELMRNGVALETALAPGLRVRANRTQVQQVVLNLMLNAVEAMAETAADERVLQVRAASADGRVRVSIRDSGSGIAGDLLERVFDGFYTTKPHGLGVGLDVCRSIVEAHGGTIWAEPNPHRGVTFHFTLPRAGDPPATARA